MSTIRRVCPVHGQAASPQRGTAAMIVYGAVVYVAFLAVFTFFIGWVDGLVLPSTINDGPSDSVGTTTVVDLIVLNDAFSRNATRKSARSARGSS